HEIQREPCVTRDNLILNTGFYISWRIDNPALSLTRVSDLENSMRLLSTAMVRAAIAEFNMQDALSRRRALNTLIRTRIVQRANDWGVAVNDTEIRELQPTDGVLRQIENRFNATLEGDAALLRSDAHVESLRRFMALEPGVNPRVLTLKYLDTLEKIGEGASTKYIIPMELFTMLQEVLRGQINGNGTNVGNGNNPPEQLPGGPIQ
ncbi:MAG TPA: SPFH domain-containing protein, partial [Anaerolineales bacterium]|nr:SPFH domain-containing protein [Anaerolineales bacterium]